MTLALIVDDSQMNIELLEEFLQLYDIDSITTLNGEEGFDLAQTRQPDVIFMDLLMPYLHWDGYQTTKALKANPSTQHIPVIAVSASGDVRKAHSVGCEEVLHRPFKMSQLTGVLERWKPSGARA